MNTRQAIIEMHKRGLDGLEIIATARWAKQFEITFFNDVVSPAMALVQYVKESANHRYCWNCHGSHHTQNCWQIGAAMRLDAEQFEMLQAACRVMNEVVL